MTGAAAEARVTAATIDYLGSVAEAEGMAPAVIARLRARAARGGKVCDTCAEHLPLRDFAPHSGMADGLKRTCRSCAVVPAPVVPALGVSSV